MNKRIKALVMTLLLVGVAGSTAVGAYDNTTNTVTTTAPAVIVKASNVTVTDKNIKENNEAITVDLKIPVIKGLKNKSIETKINNIFYNDAIKFKAPLEKQAKADLKSSKKDKTYHFNKYSAVTVYKVRYNKNNILSITVVYGQYTGGANGLDVQRSYNFDLNTGKVIPLANVFDKNFDYKKVISAEVLSQMKANSENFFSDAIKSFKGIKTDQPYYIENGNVVVYYGPFEIAPHSTGTPEFKVPFSKLSLNKNLGIK